MLVVAVHLDLTTVKRAAIGTRILSHCPLLTLTLALALALALAMALAVALACGIRLNKSAVCLVGIGELVVTGLFV